MARRRRPAAPRLPAAVEEFLKWLELDRHASPGTVAQYRGDLDLFCDFAADSGFANRRASGLDRDLVRAHQRHVARARTKRGRPKSLAPGTRKRRLVSLRSFLRFAAREEWLNGDLGATIDLPKLADRLPKPIEDSARTKTRYRARR